MEQNLKLTWKAKLSKIGNSSYIHVPRHIVMMLQLQHPMVFDGNYEDGKITLTSGK